MYLCHCQLIVYCCHILSSITPSPSCAVSHSQRSWMPVLGHGFRSQCHLLHPMYMYIQCAERKSKIKTQPLNVQLLMVHMCMYLNVSYFFLLVLGRTVNILLQQSHSLAKLLVSKLKRLIFLHMLSEVHLSITQALLKVCDTILFIWFATTSCTVYMQIYFVSIICFKPELLLAVSVHPSRLS